MSIATATTPYPAHTLSTIPSFTDGELYHVLRANNRVVLEFWAPNTWPVSKGEMMDLHGTLIGKGLWDHKHGLARAKRSSFS